MLYTGLKTMYLCEGHGSGTSVNPLLLAVNVLTAMVKGNKKAGSPSKAFTVAGKRYARPAIRKRIPIVGVDQLIADNTRRPSWRAAAYLKSIEAAPEPEDDHKVDAGPGGASEPETIDSSTAAAADTEQVPLKTDEVADDDKPNKEADIPPAEFVAPKQTQLMTPPVTPPTTPLRAVAIPFVPRSVSLVLKPAVLDPTAAVFVPKPVPRSVSLNAAAVPFVPKQVCAEPLVSVQEINKTEEVATEMVENAIVGAGDVVGEAAGEAIEEAIKLTDEMIEAVIKAVEEAAEKVEVALEAADEPVAGEGIEKADDVEMMQLEHDDDEGEEVLLASHSFDTFGAFVDTHGFPSISACKSDTDIFFLYQDLDEYVDKMLKKR